MNGSCLDLRCATPHCALANGMTWTHPQELHEEIVNEFNDDQRARAWSDASETVKTYHDEMINRWNQEMDTLLVYVSLLQPCSGWERGY